MKTRQSKLVPAAFQHAMVIHLDRAAWFHVDVHEELPTSFAITPSTRLLHPLLAARMSEQLQLPLPWPGLDCRHIAKRWGEGCLFDTDYAVVLCDSEPVFRVVSQELVSFYGRLRHLSRQAALPPQPCAAFHVGALPDFDHVDAAKEVRAYEAGVWSTWNDFSETAIQTRHLVEAARLGPEFSPSIHSDVLLDAVHAFAQNDFRKTILYAATAIESAASFILAKAYADAVSSAASHFRIVSIQGEERDPIWEHLSKGTSFRALLHERPLYLLRRSLLVEEKGIYDNARRLYASRNKYAHGAQPQENTLQLVRQDALLAIQCARAVLEWFGEDARYPAREDFVTLNSEPKPNTVGG